MFYSMVWGIEKFNKWIIFVVVFLVQDIFFIQFFKVIFVVFLLFILLCKFLEEDREEVQDGEVVEILSIEIEGLNLVEDELQSFKMLLEFYIFFDLFKVVIVR